MSIFVFMSQPGHVTPKLSIQVETLDKMQKFLSPEKKFRDSVAILRQKPVIFPNIFEF